MATIQGRPGTAGSMEHIPPQSLQKDQPRQNLDFKLLASGAAREHVSVVWKPPSCGNVVRQPEETDTDGVRKDGKGRGNHSRRIRVHGKQQKADIGTQKIKLVMEWPNLETLSKKCDRNQEMETNHEKVMGIRRQQTHNGLPGEKVGKSDNLDSSE